MPRDNQESSESWYYDRTSGSWVDRSALDRYGRMERDSSYRSSRPSSSHYRDQREGTQEISREQGRYDGSRDCEESYDHRDTHDTSHESRQQRRRVRPQQEGQEDEGGFSWKRGLTSLGLTVGGMLVLDHYEGKNDRALQDMREHDEKAERREKKREEREWRREQRMKAEREADRDAEERRPGYEWERARREQAHKSSSHYYRYD